MQKLKREQTNAKLHIVYAPIGELKPSQALHRGWSQYYDEVSPYHFYVAGKFSQ